MYMADCDIILCIIVIAAILEVYCVAAVQRRKPPHPCKLLCVECTSRNQNCQIFVFLLTLNCSHKVNIQQCDAELCADELVVGGGVGWSNDRRRRRAAHFSSAAAAWLYGRRRRRRRRQTMAL